MLHGVQYDTTGEDDGQDREDDDDGDDNDDNDDNDRDGGDGKEDDDNVGDDDGDDSDDDTLTDRVTLVTSSGRLSCGQCPEQSLAASSVPASPEPATHTHTHRDHTATVPDKSELFLQYTQTLLLLNWMLN